MSPTARRWIIVAAVLIPLLLIAAGGTAWFLLRPDTGRYEAAPHTCTTIEPLVELLGEPYELRPGGIEERVCELWLPPDHEEYVDVARLRVGFAPIPSVGEARDMMAERDPAFTPIPAIAADEAYEWKRSVFFRESNLIVKIDNYPLGPTTEEQVTTFATALAERL